MLTLTIGPNLGRATTVSSDKPRWLSPHPLAQARPPGATFMRLFPGRPAASLPNITGENHWQAARVAAPEQ
jgi:hypothetical protein